ncbi:FAD-binding oxidoreductase [Nocardioides albus]|uniref:FAD/FMN-containing dehydrogenase n=1 Tax=Nocardioides albus TaxID=1841 RepID=A0A7W5A4F7_9ACTN|nr:FAD-binding oxidoreductase [Nocardioides albus]MBB3089310.1 FAD/FMN-containing dehydrogenase [Nocardioides albus]GGU12849.1 FAD-linked oxidase [Nocardioides albus]
MRTTTHGWGRYPVVETEVHRPRTYAAAAAALDAGPLIARGLGRSYGDSSLAPRQLDLTGLDHLLAFDPATGLLTCEAGVSLATVMDTMLPRGWFPPVTPGTRYVTVGGAVASDVHGKNHHKHGSFTDHVTSMKVLLGTGEIVETSHTAHPDLFRATCGGMGLTGVVLEVTFRLIPVRSKNVDETVVKAPDLTAALDALEEHDKATYTVAWIDLLARGSRLGRSLVMAGEHAEDGDLAADRSAASARVPFDTPSPLLNKVTVSAFNRLYYARVRKPLTHHTVGYEPFFHPLDAIADWNRLYGRRGFVQYQFVTPLEAGSDVVREAIRRVADAGLASPLAVLKVFGPGNDNHLSFPTAGYTLALDFKADQRAYALCDELDQLVIAAGGRLYLTKDARMSPETFAQSYPRLAEFEDVRRRYGAVGVFASAQSRRLGVT